MSEIRLKYSSLEDVVSYSVKARGRIDDYVEEIGRAITTPISNLSGSDSVGYVESATTLAGEKVEAITAKKIYFDNLEATVKSLIAVAEDVDDLVADNISTIAEGYIEDRKWYEAVGDWIYNTFCVDWANHFSLVKDFVDGIKWVGDKVGNVLDDIHDWFKYGDGKYIWQITTAVVGAAVAIVGTVAAICAIPFSGGLSIPLVIGCIGAAATAIGSIITVGNSVSTVITNSKALSLSGNIFDDDDGNPGAARYYGSATKMSEAFEKYDYGDQETNEGFKTAGEVIDKTKVVADTTAFVCNIASLGNVKDYRVTTRNDNVNFRYNGDKWYKGYSFTYDNIKKNVLHGMGWSSTNDKFKKGSFKLNLIQDSKVSKYSIIVGKKVYFETPEKLVKVFNGVKTVDNVLDVSENTYNIYDFATESDKDLAGVGNTVESITGIGGQTDFFAVFDDYGTKTGKTIGNLATWAITGGV